MVRRHFGVLVLLLLPAASRADDLNFEQAVIAARASSPDALSAQARIAQGEAMLGQARAMFSPTLSVSTSYRRTDNPVEVFGTVLNQESFSPELDFNDVPEVDNSRSAVEISVPLFAGGSNVAGFASASAALKAQEHSSRNALLRIEFETARAYFESLKARDFVAVAESNVSAFEGNLAAASERFRAGSALKTDELDMSVKLAEAREGLVRATNAERISLSALRTVIGSDSEVGVRSESESGPKLPTAATPTHPALAAAAEQELSAQKEIDRARAGYLPRIDAVGSYEYNVGSELDGEGENYGAGIVARWNLWDGMLTTNQVNRARAQHTVAAQDRRKAQLAIAFERERAERELLSAEERVKLTGQVVEQAEESAALTRRRYREGLATSTQVVDAEAALINARYRRTEARSDRLVAISSLRYAYGLSQLETE